MTGVHCVTDTAVRLMGSSVNNCNMYGGNLAVSTVANFINAYMTSDKINAIHISPVHSHWNQDCLGNEKCL